MNRLRHRLRKIATGAAIFLLVTAAAVACGGARNTLGTSASACFRALPGAKHAVSNKGRLVGVKKFPVSTLERRIHNDPRLAGIPARENLCVFAFHGTFQPADVPQAPARSPGSYAVVALTLNQPHVVAVYVLDHLPTRFRHTRA